MSFNSTAVIETIVNAVPKNIYFLPPKTYPGTSNVGTAAPYQVNWDPPLSKFDDTSTTLPRYQEYASLFTLTFPATLRQPLYTAAQVFAERSRQQWWDFYRYPVVYSAYGASAPSTLAQLEDPIPAISVPDSEISAMAQQKAVDGDITSYPIIWGATRTTTFETSVTAEPGDVVFLRFPTLTGPVPTEYTTLPAPTDPAAKDFPNGLPVLVLTQVNGVILDSRSTTLTTATVVQAPPAPFTAEAGEPKLELVPPTYKWSTWSKAGRAGVIAAAVLSALIIVVLVWYGCLLIRRRKQIDMDNDKGHATVGPTGVRGRLTRWLAAYAGSRQPASKEGSDGSEERGRKRQQESVSLKKIPDEEAGMDDGGHKSDAKQDRGEQKVKDGPGKGSDRTPG